MRKRILNAGVVAVGALLAAAPLGAQMADAVRPPAVYFGAQALYGRPVGEFRDYVQHGGGFGVNVVWPIPGARVIGLRADGGFLVYGSERNRVCFSSTVGCRVQLDLTTTNSIAHFNFGPQLMLPDGPVRPYVNGAIGFSYFATTSSVEGSNNNEPFANTTNFDDATFGVSGGGGVLIRLARGRTPVFLDIGTRYNGNGEVEYLKKGDIQDTPGGIVFTPTRSEANLVTFQFGVSVGARSQTR
jgi:hypothetical protein